MARSRKAKKRAKDRREEQRKQQAVQSVGGGLSQPATVSRRPSAVRAPAPDLPPRRVSDLAPSSAMPTARRVSQPFKSLNVTVDPALASKARKAPAKRADASSALGHLWQRAQAKLQAFSRRADPDKAERLDRPNCGPRPNYGGKGNSAASIAQAVKPKKDFVPWC